MALSRLEVSCLAAAGAGAGALGAAGALLPTPGAGSASFWVAGVCTWAWVAWRLWHHRADNLPRDASDRRSPPEQTLGWATAVTLFRAWLIALVAAHLFLPPVVGRGALVIGLLYTLAALLDGLDGPLARRRGAVTRLGARLDVAVDALGLLVVPIVAVRAGRLPPWYLLLALAYPSFRAAVAVRRLRGLPLFPEHLRPDPRARFFAGVQMTVVAASFYPVLPVPPIWAAASVAMLPTLALFAREWRLVTGTLAPDRLDRGRLDRTSADDDEDADAPEPCPTATRPAIRSAWK